MENRLHIKAFQVLVFAVMLFFARSVFAQPANINCSAAKPLCGPGTYQSQSTGGTTGLAYPPISAWDCNGDLNGPVFYTFITTPENDPVIINVLGSCDDGGNMQAEVFTNSNPSNCAQGTWTSIECHQNSGNSIINLTGLLQASTTYYLVIDNFPNDQCQMTINIEGNESVFDLPSNAAVCQGDSATLTAGNATSYRWMPGNLTTSSIKVSPNSTTTYTLELTSPTCVNTTTATVTVNPLPVISATDMVLCIGDSLTLTPDIDHGIITNHVSFSNEERYPIDNLDTAYSHVTVTGLSGNINANSIVSVCMNLIHTDDSDLDIFLICPNGTLLELSTDNGAGGDNYSNTCFTRVGSLITTGIAPFIGNYLPEGAGGLAQLAGCSANGTWRLAVYDDTNGDIGYINNWTLTINNVDPTMSYDWTGTSMLNNSTASPTVFPDSTAQYNITVTNALGCTSSDSLTVTVAPLPEVSAGNDTTVCRGSVLELNATGAAQYAWESAAFVNDSTLSNPVAATDTTRIFIVTGTSPEGCIDIDTVKVTISVDSIDAGQDVVTCSADSIQLNATGNAAQFAWSPAIYLSDSTVSNPKAFSDTTVTYYVTGTTALGCIVRDSVTVALYDLTATAGRDTSICLGGSVTMQAAGGTQYSWSPATGLSNASIGNPVASPLTTTVYEVTIENNTCIKVDTVIVTVKPLPVVQLSNDTVICFGDSAKLSASGGVSFLWSPAQGMNNTSIANPSVSPAQTSVYTVLVTDTNGCSSQASVTIEVKPLPAVNAGLDVSICEGSLANLNVVGGISYSWAPAAGLSSTAIATPSAGPAATTEYTVTVTGNNGCFNKDTVVVTVNPSNLSVGATATVVSCYGKSDGTATAIVTGGSGSYNYMWFPGSYTSGSVQNLVAGTYSVMVTDAVTSCRDTGMVTIIQPPDFSIAASSQDATCGLPNGSAAVAVTGTGAFTYSWSTNPAQTTSAATGLSMGVYTVSVYDTANCRKDATVTINDQGPVGASFITSGTTGDAPLTVSFTNTTTNGNVYIWDFGDGNGATTTNASHVYETPGTYEVVLTAINAPCSDTARVTINALVPLDFIIPNVFTPNGDNINDLFTIKGQGMTDFSAKIFNRWGEALYEWYDPAAGWDGGDQDDGTYFYIIQFTPLQATVPSVYTGSVTLIRK